MNFLVIYHKDKAKFYFNIADISVFYVGPEGLRIQFLSNSQQIEHGKDDYVKWELI